ncbi:hypothetical protein P5V15_013327 [Pogonomyrmex californicus]
MASSKRKTRNPPVKKRIKRVSHSGIRSRIKLARKRADTPYRRQSYDSVNIPQLVYELLTIDKYNQEIKRSSSERFGMCCRRIPKSHKPQRLPHEVVDHCNGSESFQIPEYTMESRPMSTDSLMEMTDAASSSAPISSTNSSVSNVSMEPITLTNSLNSAKALLRKKSLVQLINSYIKAGIEEGKRQAKNYIRKALSFGVRSGYLIPTDRQGNVLRVCPTLDTTSCNSRRVDIESRRKRRIARRGETRLTTIADRKAMRRGFQHGKTFHNVDNRRMAFKKRCGTQHTQSPAKSLSTRENSPRRLPDKSLRKRSKLKVFARKNSKINNKKHGQRKNDDDGNVKMPLKRRRTAFSAKCVESHNEPIEESYEDINERNHDQYKNNENSYGSITERQTSLSNQEDGARLNKRKKIETNINDDKIDCDRIKNRHANDKKSEEANVELDQACRYCGQKHHNEIVDSTSRTIGRSIDYRVRQKQYKNDGRISKLYNVKQNSIFKDLSISHLQKCVDKVQSMKKAKRYIKSALDFDVESGYLIPSDPTYKILRVSSDLMKNYYLPRSKINMHDPSIPAKIPSNTNTNTITNTIENLQVQEQGRKRGRRGKRGKGQRSKSSSKVYHRSRKSKKGRRRSRSRSRGHRNK